MYLLLRIFFRYYRIILSIELFLKYCLMCVYKIKICITKVVYILFILFCVLRSKMRVVNYYCYIPSYNIIYIINNIRTYGNTRENSFRQSWTGFFLWA